MRTRPDWDTYFLGVAEAVSERADCTRRKVGAVIVKHNRIVSTGYNGAPAGKPGCLEGACPRGRFTHDELPPEGLYDTGPGSCIAIHAEANAIIYANLLECHGSTMYITCDPCDGCFKLIQGALITRVITPQILSKSGGAGS
jgi:dCMP deaminase